MSFKNLREFISYLESNGQLKRITYPVDPAYEITEISDRVLRDKGPALLFENVIGSNIPIITNLFGTPERVALGMGQKNLASLRELGKLLANLKEPEVPSNIKEVLKKLPLIKKIWSMPVKKLRHAPCQEIVIQEDEVNIDKLPIMTCWQDDIAPLLTWGLTITQGPNKKRQNLGIYRQQKLSKNKIIMRWLAHRGGALDLQDWIKENPDKPFPVTVAFGADPATILAAVTPIPDSMSEYSFAGLLRGSRTQTVRSISNNLLVPASAEIVFEGYIDPNEFANEGPFGDHTGYYNEKELHNVFTITHITMRKNPIYHSTYTGRPPDEPAVLGAALNELFIPILQKQFPEIVDFYLPPEGCSYRMAVVTIQKQYAGHARRIMMGVWSFLRQFMYTKFIIVCDENINARDWDEVVQAMIKNMDPAIDSLFIDKTPIDSLDFASPVVGLGSKLGLDATIKLPIEVAANFIIKPCKVITLDKIEQFKKQYSVCLDLHVIDGAFVLCKMHKEQAYQSQEFLSNLKQLVGSVKFIILCDQDVDIRDWNDVIWAITTRIDPVCDIQQNYDEIKKISMLVFDATNKFAGEVMREWGRSIVKDQQLLKKIDNIWNKLKI